MGPGDDYEYHDLTIPVRPGMPQWPGSPPLVIERVSDVAAGDPFTMTALRLDSHTGTHIDAPRHFLADGECLDRMPPNAVVGPARVIEVHGTGQVTLEDVESFGPVHGERILLKTRNSLSAWWEHPFTPDYTSLSLEAARRLAGVGVNCVGIDYLSIAAPDDEASKIHRVLLGAGIWIIEGLDLMGIEPGDYELLCLPLLIEGCDGAPVRAVLRRRAQRM
ncbi:MAG: cyclase family protein [Actinobacteria bacterium]|nr:cyclase family protein [Actinomycetota bacterium]MBU1945084.1 cyclase family protein [Actinomycetota bacterium]MBU2688353.1 cyclase family protein [Actinomycetota bacterium]